METEFIQGYVTPSKKGNVHCKETDFTDGMCPAQHSTTDGAAENF